MAEIYKNTYFGGKASAVNLSKYVRIKALSPLVFPGKIRLLSALFGRKQGGVTSQRIRIEISLILFQPHNSGQLFINVLIPGLSNFAAKGHKGHFRKILVWISNLAAFLGTTPHLHI